MELNVNWSLNLNMDSLIKTMGIDEAAKFLRMHKVTLSELAKQGKVPAAKPAKEWVREQ